jgi:mannitol-specific phosphotransferase system IIBC component
VEKKNMPANEQMEPEKSEGSATGGIIAHLPPVSPGKLLTAQTTLSSEAPESGATQKVQIDYLRRMVSALIVSFSAYKFETEKKLTKLKTKTNNMGDKEEESSDFVHVREFQSLSNQVQEMQNQLDTDIGHLATRCQMIEQKLEKITERFHYDVETTLVAQHAPVTTDEDANILQYAERLVHEGTGTTGVRVIRANETVWPNIYI